MDFTNIIFRGRRQDEKKTWIFGDLEHSTTDMFINVTSATEDMHKYPISLFSRCCVESQTVGVNFGHKDINGTLIFTGDIVKDKDNNVFIIKIEERAIFMESLEQMEIAFSILMPEILQLKVIGNIFDNPELLKNNFLCLPLAHSKNFSHLCSDNKNNKAHMPPS